MKHRSPSPFTQISLFYCSLSRQQYGFWVPPSVDDIFPILAIGVTGTFAPLLYTTALRIADASIIAATDFLRLPITAGLAFALFGEVPDIWVWIGGGIIFFKHLVHCCSRKSARKIPQRSEKGRLMHTLIRWFAARPANVRGLIWCLLAAITFMSMVMIVRRLSTEFNAGELAFWRALFGLLLLAPVLMRTGAKIFRTKKRSAYTFCAT